MDRATVNGIELAYEVRGSGEPVLLIHGAHIADAFLPLMSAPALEPFRLIRYHRRGLGASGRRVPVSPSTIEEHAHDGLGLLDHLGIEEAHVVGHSSGGAMALELAAGHPARVSSLALLEPFLGMTPGAAAFIEWLMPLVAQYESGDADGAVRGFLSGLGDAGSLAAIERTVPGAVEQAVRDATTFFGAELAGGASWSFGAEKAAPITCPVLSVLGEESTGLWVEGRELLHAWFPQCRDADVAGTGHLLQLEQPMAVAEALGRFLGDCDRERGIRRPLAHRS